MGGGAVANSCYAPSSDRSVVAAGGPIVIPQGLRGRAWQGPMSLRFRRITRRLAAS